MQEDHLRLLLLVIGSIIMKSAVAVGKSISPLLIVAEILLLVGPQGRKNGWAYVLGWLIGTIVFGVVVYRTVS